MAHGSNWTVRPPYVPGEFLRLIDPFTHAVTVIQEPHRLAHDGMVFSSTGKATGLANAGVFEFTLSTGNSYPHLNKMRLSFGAGDIDVLSFKNATWSSAGTPLVPVNTNLNSSNTPVMSMAYNPTLLTDGTEVHTMWAPPTATGVGQSQSGLANLDAGEEWILAPNTQYLFRITNNSGVTIDMAWDFLWYEVSYTE